MNAIYKYLSLFLFGLVLFGCNGLNTNIEIDPPEFEEKLVVSLFAPQAGVDVEMGVGTNLNIIGERDFSKFQYQNAQATITNNTTGEMKLFENYNNISLFSPNYYLENDDSMFFSTGHEYTLNVDGDSLGIASATATFPDVVDIDEIDVDIEGGITEDGDEATKITLSFDDPVGEDNYYELMLAIEQDRDDGGISTTYEYLYSSDLAVSRGHVDKNLLLEDANFDGEQKELVIRVPQFLFTNDEYRPILIFSHITYDHYLFLKTLGQSNDAEDNPFIAPVQVHTNIENGLGLFGLVYINKYEL